MTPTATQTPLAPDLVTPPPHLAPLSPERRAELAHDSSCATGSVILLEHDSGDLLAIRTFCNRWDCPRCGHYRLMLARAKARAGAPERLITLTTRPRPGLSTETSVRWLRDRFKRLLARLRRHFPRMEYMAFVELHKSGWPHMHILTRGAYVPQRTLSRWWTELTGSFKVHIQQINRTWKGVQEATKYCLKTAQQIHAVAPRLPVYTMSRGWLPDDWNQSETPAGSYTFYCSLRMDLDEVADHAAMLGCDVCADDENPHRLRIRAGPNPPWHTIKRIYDIGSFDTIKLTSSLEALWDLAAGRAPDHQGRMAFLTGKDRDA